MTEPMARLSDVQCKLNLASFERIWSTVRDTHWDPDIGGIDWQETYDELRPRVEQAVTMREARRIMETMLTRLGHSHFSLLYDDDQGTPRHPASRQGGDGTTGIDVRFIEGQVVIVSVEPGSGAETVGVQPGWCIVRVNGEELRDVLQSLQDRLEGRTDLGAVLASQVRSRMRGPVGESVKVAFLDGQESAIGFDIPLQPAKGRIARTVGNLSRQRVWLEARSLDGDIGYVAFNRFLDPAYLLEQFSRAMGQFLDSKGIIIDLRGNAGGLGAMSPWMAGWLIAEKGRSLSTNYTRHRTLEATIVPRARTYAGPLAILVDDCTESTAEEFAAGLKGLGRACIVGSRTAGACLSARVDRLPNGDRFVHAIARCVPAGGVELEGRGLEPDIVAHPTREALLQGRDTAMEAALVWITDHERGSP